MHQNNKTHNNVFYYFFKIFINYNKDHVNFLLKMVNKYSVLKYTHKISFLILPKVKIKSSIT